MTTRKGNSANSVANARTDARTHTLLVIPSLKPGTFKIPHLTSLYMSSLPTIRALVLVQYALAGGNDAAEKKTIGKEFCAVDGVKYRKLSSSVLGASRGKVNWKVDVKVEKRKNKKVVVIRNLTKLLAHFSTKVTLESIAKEFSRMGTNARVKEGMVEVQGEGKDRAKSILMDGRMWGFDIGMVTGFC